MNEYQDKNGTLLMPGDVIDIGQTVNGQSEFYVNNVDPIDIRYNYDKTRKYEYDQEEILRACRFTGYAEFVILQPQETTK
jgi:hypothetical protein